jgi:outer membrane protein assembly factor BamB
MLDAHLADAIEQVHALSQSPISDSARERIHRKVFEQSVTTRGDVLVNLDVTTLPLPNPNGPVLPIPRPPENPALETGPRPHARWAMLAAAMLLVLAGGAAFFTQDGWPDRLSGIGMSDEPEGIPASTPESGWPQFRGGAGRTGYSADPGPGGDLDPRWTFTADEVLGGPVSDGASVYVYGRKGTLYSLDASTGAQRWGVDLSPGEYPDDNRWPVPAVQKGVVYVGTYEGNIVALDAASGDLIWQRALSSQPIVASPVVADDGLYLVAPSGAVVGLDAATGETRWEWSGEFRLSNLAMAAGRGHVYIPDGAGGLVAIETTSGQTAWIAEVGNAWRNPAYSDGVVYVGDEMGSYNAVDATDGSIIWTSDPMDGYTVPNPIVTPSLLITAAERGPMSALDRKTGQVVWSVDGPGYSVSPESSSTAVYGVSSDLTAVVAYDLESGAELGRMSAESLGTVAAISGQMLVVGSFDLPSVIRAFGPGEGDVIESSAQPVSLIPPATLSGSETTTATEFDISQIELVWQSSGSEIAPLQHPGRMNLAPNGKLYVCDEGAGNIQVFSSDGKWLESWGEPGSGPGQFNAPGDIDFDADGNIYVFDTGNHRIQKFDREHTFIMEWGTHGIAEGEFDGPYGAVDSAFQRIYVADSGNNRIQVFDLDGTFLETWGSAGNLDGQFQHPTRLVVRADGGIVVAEEANGGGVRIQSFDRNGGHTSTVEQGSYTSARLDFDAEGTIFMGDVWTLSEPRFDPDLNWIVSNARTPWFFFWDQVSLISNAIADTSVTTLETEGFLYVSDPDNSRILKFKLPPITGNHILGP